MDTTPRKMLLKKFRFKETNPIGKGFKSEIAKMSNVIYNRAKYCWEDYAAENKMEKKYMEKPFCGDTNEN